MTTPPLNTQAVPLATFAQLLTQNPAAMTNLAAGVTANLNVEDFVGPEGPQGPVGPAASITTPTTGWNASTNTPTLASGVGTAGATYVVTTAGTTNLDGITTWNVGDVAVFGTGGHWFRIPLQAATIYTLASVVIPTTTYVPVDILLDGQGRVLEVTTTTGAVYTFSATGLTQSVSAAQLTSTYQTAAVIPGVTGQVLEVTVDTNNRILEYLTTTRRYILGAKGPYDPSAVNQNVYDVIVYGGNIGGIMAAYHYWLAGYRVALLEPLFYWGGAQAAGLTYADLPDGTANQNACLGGLTESVWFQGIVNLYNNYHAYRYNYEPKVAEQLAQNLIASMAAPAPGNSTGYVRAFLNCPVSSQRDILLASSGSISGTNAPAGAILGIVTPSGLLTATLFHDASYTGDLLRVHGTVPWINGRESTATYGETYAGYGQLTQTFTGLAYVDYPPVGVTNNGTPNETIGQGDALVMPDNFRFCVTRTAGNIIPFQKPSDYSFLLVRGTLAIYASLGYTTFCNATAGFVSTNLGYQATLPNGKVNVNGFDCINLKGNSNIATWSQREVTYQNYYNFVGSLLYAIQNDPQTVSTFPNLAALQADSLVRPASG